MAKARGLEAKLARLKVLRKEDHLPAHVAELRSFLGDKSNFVVAEASEIVAERMLVELSPDLVVEFRRLLDDPVESDPLCRGKVAIVETLNKLEYDEDDVFLVGVKHVQMEPVWGKSEDSAGHLRGASAFGLVRTRYRDIELLLADLLADPEKVARCHAAHAMGAVGSAAAIALLRFKCRVGDEESEVVSDCLSALMQAAPSESTSFVGEFLDSEEEGVAEGAALALAESRKPEAFELLKKRWSKVRDESFQKVLLLAISITRLPAAVDMLLDILSDGNERVALIALSALGIQKHNPTITERIAAVVAKRGGDLQKTFRKDFAAGE